MIAERAGIENIINNTSLEKELKDIAVKVLNKKRLTIEEGVLLFEKADISYLGTLANHIRYNLHGDKVYFNRNFHIEPTNVCVFACDFCSYSRKYNPSDAEDARLLRGRPVSGRRRARAASSC